MGLERTVGGVSNGKANISEDCCGGDQNCVYACRAMLLRQGETMLPAMSQRQYALKVGGKFQANAEAIK